VCCRAAVAHEGTQELACLARVMPAPPELAQEDQVRAGIVVQVSGADAADVGCGVAAVREPALLLPAAEARRPPRDVLLHGLRDAGVLEIREHGVESGRGGTARNAPRTEAVDDLLHGEHGTAVDVFALAAAACAVHRRAGDGACGEWVGVVAEARKIHAPWATM
jgi:hypothetical protein